MKLDSNPMPGHSVRITLPAKVAFNLEHLQSSLKQLAERLGHAQCLSGAHCILQLERDFVINPVDMKIHAVDEITGR